VRACFPLPGPTISTAALGTAAPEGSVTVPRKLLCAGTADNCAADKSAADNGAADNSAADNTAVDKSAADRNSAVMNSSGLIAGSPED
jgi:hypothetical protein